jgi:hypothetical protein
MFNDYQLINGQLSTLNNKIMALEISEEIKSILNQCFERCKNFPIFMIPKSVSFIGNECFFDVHHYHQY